ncbi:hypothetical protein ACWXYR_06045, partial [Streptococcus pneumoniae]
MRKEDLMMKFRKNQNKEKQIPKEKKPRVYKVNPHKKVVIALWVLLGLSFSFAIFKHFTAIDTHTIHETTIIPNHSYLSQLDVTYKTPDLMSHFLPPHEVSFTFCCSSIVFPR